MKTSLSSNSDGYKHIGEYLKKERKARNISLREIADVTRISKHRLKSIEDNRRDQWPAEIFVKGFIKSYSEYIGLDTTDVMNRYQELNTGHFIADADTAHAEKIQPPQKAYRYIMPIAASILLIITAACLWFFRGDLIEISQNSGPKITKAEAAGSNLSDSSELLPEKTVAKPEERTKEPSRKTDI